MKRLRRAWRRFFPASPEECSRGPGRPPGSRWSDKEDLERALLTAVEALEEKGQRPTQEKVAGLMHCDPRTLRRWLKEFGVSWLEVTRYYLSRKS